MILVNTYITLSFAFGATIYKSSHFILNNGHARKRYSHRNRLFALFCTIMLSRQ